MTQTASVIVNIFPSSEVDNEFDPLVSNQRLLNWYLLFFRSAHNI